MNMTYKSHSKNNGIEAAEALTLLNILNIGRKKLRMLQFQDSLY